MTSTDVRRAPRAGIAARDKLAAAAGLSFIALFFMSGIAAVATVSDVEVSTSQSLGAVLFSLSSFSALLLPISLTAMVMAVTMVLGKRRAPGMLFAGISAAMFALFMLLYAGEGLNNSLYTILGDQLKELGVKFRKRDFSAITVTYSPAAYLTCAAGALTAALAAPPLKTERDRRATRKALVPYAYVGPHLLFFIVFFITPSIYGVYAAFTRWNLFNDPVWVGLENFRTLLFQKGNTYYAQLRNGLWNTVKFVLYSVPFCILVPLALAIALQQRPRGHKFFQAVYYFPALMSITTVSLTWRYMFVKSYGAVSNFFMLPGDWLVPPHSWIALVIMTVWWYIGGTMVIYQSALASIPVEHYEAAAVDGANGWRKFLHITLPGIRYPLSYTLVITVIGQFNIYGQPLMLTGFGNQEANAVLLMYVYENAIKKQVAGMSAAMALILGVCVMAVSFVQARLMRANTPA
ncbi:MAG: sugar ABC transporter permease [Oscillospiraceae bacterium]|jgi:multiple sugar transport system permease protein|nr:sugar ABC transporter permease [Oscillospiraceae bacterium]